MDVIQYGAQKGLFLQRRKSVCLCGSEYSHKSTTGCKDLDRDSYTKTKKNGKKLSFCKDLSSLKIISVFQIFADCFQATEILTKICFFLTFFRFLARILIQILTTCGALVRILRATQAHTFATMQKKALLSTILYDIHTRAAPKNHPKKVLKKAFRRAWISDCYIELHFVKSTKFSSC